MLPKAQDKKAINSFPYGVQHHRGLCRWHSRSSVNKGIVPEPSPTVHGVAAHSTGQKDQETLRETLTGKQEMKTHRCWAILK